MQLGQIRGDEARKASDAFNALAGEIQRLRSEGNSVTITVVAEVPDSFDFAGYVTDSSDISQVVFFKKMSISSVIPLSSSRQAAADTSHSAYSANLAPNDPDEIDNEEMTLDQQINAQLSGKKPLKPGRGARPGHHLVRRDQAFPPLQTGNAQGRQKGLLGVYRPIKFGDVSIGDSQHVQAYGMSRRLIVRQTRIVGDLVMAEMWDTNEATAYATDRWRLDVAAKTFDGTFSRPKTSSSGAYRIVSKGIYVGDDKGKGEFLVEDASGQDLDPAWSKGSEWRATILWEKV
jgi:hypothetical protein